MAHFFKEHFFGGGGGEGGGFGGGFGGEEEKEIDNKKLYEVLGVKKEATPTEIKKAFKKMAIKHHPDRGGDAEKFKECNAAYEVLSNTEKRSTYDKYGFDGLKSGGMSSGGFGDIFDIFFGGRGGGGGRRQRETPQMKPTVKQAKISLHDAFHGKMLHVEVERKRVCLDCSGKGGSEVQICKKCKGKGIVVKLVQMGPGMYSQSQAYCPDCSGEGKTIKKEHLCKGCKGDKILVKTETVEVPIETGCPDKAKLKVPGKGNEHPEYRAGDLYVIIEVKNHDVFTRKGSDLHITKKVGLIEALSGFSFNLSHLNDTDVTISVPAKTVVRHLDVMRVRNLGMPKYKESLSFGDLYVNFEVLCPKNLSTDQIAKLSELLPKGVLPPVVPTKNTYKLENVSKSGKKKYKQHQGHGHMEQEEEYEEEGEGQEGPGGQRVECNHQ